MKLNLNPDDLTFGDMEDFETFSGRPLMDTFDKVGADGSLTGMSAKEIVGLIWICGRASDPEFTIDQARRVKVAEIEVEASEPDPTPGSTP